MADGGWRERVATIEGGLRAGLEPARELPGVVDVRVLGAIGVVQMREEVDVAAVTAAAVEHGVWLRPFRDLIYTMPPYVIVEDDLATCDRGDGGSGRAEVRRTGLVRATCSFMLRGPG